MLLLWLNRRSFVVGDLLQFPQPKGQFLATINLFIQPDGSIEAYIKDMPKNLIENMGGEPHEKLTKVALWTQKGAESLAEQANSLRPSED